MSDHRDHAEDVVRDYEQGIEPRCTCKVHTSPFEGTIERIDTWIHALEGLLSRMKELNSQLRKK